MKTNLARFLIILIFPIIFVFCIVTNQAEAACYDVQEGEQVDITCDDGEYSCPCLPIPCIATLEIMTLPIKRLLHQLVVDFGGTGSENVPGSLSISQLAKMMPLSSTEPWEDGRDYGPDFLSSPPDKAEELAINVPKYFKTNMLTNAPFIVCGHGEQGEFRYAFDQLLGLELAMHDKEIKTGVWANFVREPDEEIPPPVESIAAVWTQNTYAKDTNRNQLAATNRSRQQELSAQQPKVPPTVLGIAYQSETGQVLASSCESCGPAEKNPEYEYETPCYLKRDVTVEVCGRHEFNVDHQTPVELENYRDAAINLYAHFLPREKKDELNKLTRDHDKSVDKFLSMNPGKIIWEDFTLDWFNTLHEYRKAVRLQYANPREWQEKYNLLPNN